MTIRNKIFNYIVNSKQIDDSIRNIVKDEKYIDDFRQHFFLQMMEMDDKKLQKAYLEGYLDKLCGRVILNQWNSNSSSFYKNYKSNRIIYSDNFIDSEDKETIKYFDYENAEKILNAKRESFINKQYYMTLFKMYFHDGYNYRQISDITGINMNSIKYSITTSIKYIKRKLKV